MGSTPRVLDVSAVDDRVWARLVMSRRSDVFHSPQWAGVLADTYGFEVRGRVLECDGSPAAGWMVVTVDDHLGSRHVTLPFSDFCDPLVDNAHQLRLLLHEYVDGPRPITIKARLCDALAELDGLEASAQLAWHGIRVIPDRDAMWEAIDPAARRAIRRARSSGISVRSTRELSDLRRFFDLHLAVRKQKYRLLPQPWRFFESIWRRFFEPGTGHLLLAEIDGRPVGGVVFLEWADRLYYKFNASDLSLLGLRPNDLVLWEGMCLAAERGLDLIDMGVSDLDQPGLIRYKEKYAGEEGRVTVYRGMSALGHDVREARKLLADITELLVDPSVPNAITEAGGDRLYRYFV